MYIPRPMDKYKHFKGNCYQIICVAESSEDGEKSVIYQALYAPYKIYSRPLDMFLSKVDTEKYPDADQEYRFELLDDEGFIVTRTDDTCDEVCEKIAVADNDDINDISDIKEEAASVVEEPEVRPLEKINPILERFLDADTAELKIEILNEEKDNLTPEILTPMELSIGMEPQDSDPLQRYREIKNFLFLKQKYERQHR